MAAVAIGLGPPLPAGAAPAITPTNRPTPLGGQTNGELPADELISVAPRCVAYRAAAPSLALLLRLARASGVGLTTNQCYRPLAGQVSVAQQWTAAGNSACAATVTRSTTGKPVGTSMHGWGKAVDWGEPPGGIDFTTPGYRFLKAQAPQLGWNHPRWAEPGGSACPEPWHWEWVGDGGVQRGDPIRADLVALLSGAGGAGTLAVSGLGTVGPAGLPPAPGESGAPIDALVVGGAPAAGGGYWLVTADGGVHGFGPAPLAGSLVGSALSAPIVGMAAAPDGRGYWLVASDGGVFAFGTARFYGSTGGQPLSRPIVGMAAAPDGGGYWLFGADGGVFAFGDAIFRGALGGIRLEAPVLGGAATSTGGGYWLFGSGGAVFAFGDARFQGSAATSPPARPVVSMAATAGGLGYRLLTADGTVMAFGDARAGGPA